MIRNILIAGCLLLAGCGTTNIIDRQIETVKPSEALYQCQLVQFPDPAKLTDRQVARLLEKLAYENRQCYNSLQAIHAFEDAADGKVKPNRQMVMQLQQVVRDNPNLITCEVSRSSSLAQGKTPCRLSPLPRN